MDFGNLGETLSKKYGPLPGYAWVGIGAVGIAVLVKLRGGSGTPAAPLADAVPATNDGSGTDGGGGGGGGLTPDPSAVLPTSVPPDSTTTPVGPSQPPPDTTTVSPHVVQATPSPSINPSLPAPELPAGSNIPNTATHPQEAPPGTIGSVPIQNTPPGSNAHQPGMQLD